MSKRGKKRRAEELRRKISEADLTFDDLWSKIGFATGLDSRGRMPKGTG